MFSSMIAVATISGAHDSQEFIAKWLPSLASAHATVV